MPDPRDDENRYPRLIWRDPRHFIAFGFGSGTSPIMPGTCGTLIAIPFYLVLAKLPLTVYVALVVFAFIIGIYLCGRTSRALGVHDHPGIVWDEVVGFWVAMTALPVTWYGLIWGFILFRVFDIWKPWPIGWIDRRVSSGLGIMTDDLIAGIYAWTLLQGLSRLVA